MGITRAHRSNHARRLAWRATLGAGLVASVLTGGFASTSRAGPHIDAATATEAIASTPSSNERSAPKRRVDLETPTFSNPTRITNRLFPISRLTQVIQLGHEADETLRHEITLLDETKFVRWNGQRVETLVSQFVAYADGRVVEIAVDFFAQADDGSVWYFGENVDNYVDGVIDNHDGTWRAGRDGPPGMIMPANPQVGDVYRPENIPGLVFEEVTVKRINQTVAGPRGPVRGAILVQERLQDGVLEDKVFAPGYGEFEASVPVEDELVTVAVAAPTDVLGHSEPRRLERLADTAAELFDDAASQRWSKLEATVGRMTATWDRYHRDVPPLLEGQMTDALDALQSAVDNRDRDELRQAVINVGHAVHDIDLQFESPDEIDEDRIDVWHQQLRLDRAAHDVASVAGDRAILGAIADRIGCDDD